MNNLQKENLTDSTNQSRANTMKNGSQTAGLFAKESGKAVNCFLLCEPAWSILCRTANRPTSPRLSYKTSSTPTGSLSKTRDPRAP